jgi:serralysin
LNGFIGSDAVFGNLGDDRYLFGPASAGEIDTRTEAVGEGTDMLSFAGVSTAVALNLAITGIQAVHTDRWISLNLNNTFENATGGSADDLLTGNSINNTLIGNAGNDRLAGQRANDTSSGGIENDVFQFDTDSGLGSDTIIDSGGIDFLDFSATTTRNIAINLGLATSQIVNGSLTLTLASASVLERTEWQRHDFRSGESGSRVWRVERGYADRGI